MVALGTDHVSVSEDAIMDFIKTSKTDQSGSGAFVQVKKSNDTVLLFQSLQNFLALHNDKKGHSILLI